MIRKAVATCPEKLFLMTFYASSVIIRKNFIAVNNIKVRTILHIVSTLIILDRITTIKNCVSILRSIGYCVLLQLSDHLFCYCVEVFPWYYREGMHT